MSYKLTKVFCTGLIILNLLGANAAKKGIILNVFDTHKVICFHLESLRNNMRITLLVHKDSSMSSGTRMRTFKDMRTRMNISNSSLTHRAEVKGGKWEQITLKLSAQSDLWSVGLSLYLGSSQGLMHNLVADWQTIQLPLLSVSLPVYVKFWADLCILHGGLICIVFCPSVCLSVTG